MLNTIYSLLLLVLLFGVPVANVRLMGIKCPVVKCANSMDKGRMDMDNGKMGMDNGKMGMDKDRMDMDSKCDAGWYPMGDWCLYLNTSRATFWSNRNLCTTLGGQMLEIYGHAQNRAIQRFLFTGQVYFQVWLGGYVQRSFRWLTRHHTVPTYENWSIELHNASQVLSCLVLQRHGTWSTSACSSHNIQVCQKPMANTTTTINTTIDSIDTESIGSEISSSDGSSSGNCTLDRVIDTISSLQSTMDTIQGQLEQLFPPSPTPSPAPASISSPPVSIVSMGNLLANLSNLLAMLDSYHHRYPTGQDPIIPKLSEHAPVTQSMLPSSLRELLTCGTIILMCILNLMLLYHIRYYSNRKMTPLLTLENM